MLLHPFSNDKKMEKSQQLEISNYHSPRNFGSRWSMEAEWWYMILRTSSLWNQQLLHQTIMTRFLDIFGATDSHIFTFMHWRRKWQPTPVFLPGESQGRGSLVGCRLWGRTVRHDWSDLAAAAGLPVHYQLPEFTQTHVHQVGDAIQASHPPSSP